MLASLPQTHNTSYTYARAKLGSGILMATKQGMNMMLSVLLSPQMAPNLFHAMEGTL